MKLAAFLSSPRLCWETLFRAPSGYLFSAIKVHKLLWLICASTGVFHIKILDKFDIDLCVTFLNFDRCLKKVGNRRVCGLIKTWNHDNLMYIAANENRRKNNYFLFKRNVDPWPVLVILSRFTVICWCQPFFIVYWCQPFFIVSWCKAFFIFCIISRR